MEDLFVREGSFICLPVQWIIDLSGDDLKKMAVLHWRFSFFADQAYAEGRDIRRCFYESQHKLATLFGMSPNSRTKVGQFIKKMEKLGYLTVDRQKILVEGEWMPRHYIVVNDPRMLAQYGMAP